MEIYRVAFMGHRKIDQITTLEQKIEKLVHDLLLNKEYVEFYIGRNGDFDILAASAIKRMQAEVGHQNSSLILVLPYSVKDEQYYHAYYDEIYYPVDPKTHYKSAISKRNQWMIENCDFLVAFVERNFGGAYQSMLYAKKMEKSWINLLNF